MIQRTFNIETATVFMFSLRLGLVTQLNDSALDVLKYHYIIKSIREPLIGNSRFLIHNSIKQLRYYADVKEGAFSWLKLWKI